MLKWKDHFATFIFWFAGLVTLTIFIFIVGDIISQGFSGISWDFLTTEPASAGREGGISTILVSTLLILLICMLAAVPLGLGTAVLLTEFIPQESFFSRAVRYSLDVLAGVPSIIFGLFGNAFFCKTLGLGFSILSGGLTLACMALPIVIRLTEMALRAVPLEQRLSGSALGFSKSTLLFQLLLPIALPGIVVGLVLGIGRAMAETAALIFTSGYVDRMPSSLMDSGRALSIHIFDLSMNVPGGDANAYRSTFVMLVLILIINALTTALSEQWLGKRILKS